MADDEQSRGDAPGGTDASAERGRALRAARASYAGELPTRAVTLYQSAREAIDAARALREEGDMPKAMRGALQVSPQAPEYPAAARLVIAVAAARRDVDQEVKDFLAPYLDADPGALIDQDAFFLLGQLYEVLDYSAPPPPCTRRTTRAARGLGAQAAAQEAEQRFQSAREARVALEPVGESERTCTP